jgi:hypothetical protein
MQLLHSLLPTLVFFDLFFTLILNACFHSREFVVDAFQKVVNFGHAYAPDEKRFSGQCLFEERVFKAMGQRSDVTDNRVG